MKPTNHDPDPEATALARAYGRVLSWPCPACGRPFPCEHDAEHALPARAGDGQATTTRAEDAEHALPGIAPLPAPPARLMAIAGEAESPEGATE